MRTLFRLLPLLLLLIDLRPETAFAADLRVNPSWMRVDADKKLVTMQMVAGWNPSNGALNFNGYYAGDATVVVPAGWTVALRFENHDGMLPHSVLVTRVYDEKDMPLMAGQDQVAIPRAYTVQPAVGIMAPKKDEIRFPAGDAGKYMLFCGVTGHGQSGMWIYLEIRAEAGEPHLLVAGQAEPGWR